MIAASAASFGTAGRALACVVEEIDLPEVDKLLNQRHCGSAIC